MAKARVLDKTKPFGTVMGGTNIKYCFMQDGCFFDSMGNEVTENGESVADILEAKQAAAAKAASKSAAGKAK